MFSRLASSSSRALSRSLSRPFPHPSPSYASSSTSTSRAVISVRHNTTDAAAPAPAANATPAAKTTPVAPDGQSSVEKARKEKFLPEFSMAGKVCIVTGGARGLGAEFCNAFLKSGCTSLAIMDLNEEEAVNTGQELVKAACATSPMTPSDYTVLGLGCDVSSELSVHQSFRRVMDAFGRVDAVVASAGIVENYAAFDYPFDRIKRLYDINVHGAFFTAREAARHMIPMGGGSVVLVASMSANIVNIPQPQTPYNAAKAAVKHMAASLAVEWAKQGVRVNCLSPGYMLTKLTRTILAHDTELKKTWESLTPMGRMGDPEDLAGAIVFLASDASRFMTGSEIRVDGGYCII